MPCVALRIPTIQVALRCWAIPVGEHRHVTPAEEINRLRELRACLEVAPRDLLPKDAHAPLGAQRAEAGGQGSGEVRKSARSRFSLWAELRTTRNCRKLALFTSGSNILIFAPRRGIRSSAVMSAY